MYLNTGSDVWGWQGEECIPEKKASQRTHCVLEATGSLMRVDFCLPGEQEERRDWTGSRVHMEPERTCRLRSLHVSTNGEEP